MNYIEFLKTKPLVIYDYYEGAETWKYFNTGQFGSGYYLLTKAMRRNPKGMFKVSRQVFNEIKKGYCKTNVVN